ncbi:MAG TPA: DUF2934 domain-containing protein [Terriglobales bacterium]|nr:DUF2934 domain-containing protein [Terriglobales bacterium]
MARKTTEPSTTRRSRKAASTTPPAAVQAAPEFQNDLPKDTLKREASQGEASQGEALNEAPKAAPKSVSPSASKNGKTVQVVPGNGVSFNVEEQIRRRAYELYLERRATAGSEGNGDPNQDWLSAEREVRSRQGGGESRA